MSQAAPQPKVQGFDVHLTNFEGPFDLLLQLISRRELDVTEVALSQVTDEFIAHIRAAGSGWGLEQTSSFLVVAATLLDLKSARLLPGGEVSDPEDVAALEARDLLFARLLQYRAFKAVSAWVAATMAEAGKSHYRPGGLEPQFRSVLPEVELRITPEDLARLAAAAMTPAPVPHVEVGHLHTSNVSLQEQVSVIAARLRREGALTFRALVDGCDKLTVVVRFLAVLELFRAQQVAVEQLTPLGDLTVRWSGRDDATIEVVDDYGPDTEGESR
ncbi:segregation and condensation protein A [Tessaracoccus caeni]|uniref:segregation and condensation protein A n=1 Tax=Tessaracoccus caeni TaxID=3031239 RepID=UPI0023DB76D9|nr:segregation/condensation protein A [Tessaracoccus caeni]MDF1488017.1 segregation/condensation protein A [Tessaracoccus caeni]